MRVRAAVGIRCGSRPAAAWPSRFRTNRWPLAAVVTRAPSRIRSRIAAIVARVVLRAEDRRAGDERVRARRRDRADVVDLDAAVHFEPDRRGRCGR